MGAAQTIKSPKAASAAECETLEQLPNIGPALAADLRLIGIHIGIPWTDEMIAMASPPPMRSMSPGTVGSSAGSTTPVVLL